MGFEGLRELLGLGRKDESGDFTKGAGLDERQIERVSGLFEFPLRHHATFCTEDPERASADMDVLEKWFVDNRRAIAGLHELFPEAAEAGNELLEMVDIFEAAGYGSRRIRVDPSVVPGLEYYTGPVYEVELLLDTKDEKGRPLRFGSDGGAGRYDGLLSRFRGQPVPATGCSIGLGRVPGRPPQPRQTRKKADWRPPR